MHDNTALVLFESTDAPTVLTDPVNEDWVAVLSAIDDERFQLLERRYYEALTHFRKQNSRPSLPGRVQVEAQDKQEALQGMLGVIVERKEKGTSEETFVEAHALSENDSTPESLRDFSKQPRSLRELLDRPGRPPCDAQCLMRAFLAAPLLGVGDSPGSVHRLLRSNPTFARTCGFMGPTAMKQPGELTSRRLPSLSVCEEFSEVMTRYGLWNLARLEQVRENLQSGVVEIEDTLVFDTTHIEANSHCDNVVPRDAKEESGKKPKHRKVPRMRKSCTCGKEQWEKCEHPWTPTDQGAAVVVKGHTRIYWSHKASVTSFGNSEIPIDARALNYAAVFDGKTLVPHLELLQRDLPEVIEKLWHILADDAYQGNQAAIREMGLQALLTVPVHPDGRDKTKVAERFIGIDRFTPTGVPICQAGHRFKMRGRDIISEKYIWEAPDDDGDSVCAGCVFAADCLNKGTRRHIRVERSDFPQIDWDHPQHLLRNRTRYQSRTGVERAIKRLKVDLRAEHLSHRDGLRVQAHLDRKLLTLHLLLAAT